MYFPIPSIHDNLQLLILNFNDHDDHIQINFSYLMTRLKFNIYIYSLYFIMDVFFFSFLKKFKLKIARDSRIRISLFKKIFSYFSLKKIKNTCSYLIPTDRGSE